MSLRDSLAKNKWIAGVLVVLAVGALGYSVMRMNQNSYDQPEGLWFYDLQSGKLIVADVHSLSPITTETGATALEAVVFSCGSCDNPESRQVGYLKRYPDKQDLTTTQVALPATDSAQELHWVSSYSEAGEQVKAAVQEQLLAECGDKLQQCFP